MSETNDIMENIYKLSQERKYMDAEEYITDKFQFAYDVGKIESIDNVLYNIDVNKINIKIARGIIDISSRFYDKLIMRNYFIERAKDKFGRDKL